MVKLHRAGDGCVDGVVAAEANTAPCGEGGAVLSHDDAASVDLLAVANFHAKALASAIASVANTSACLFVCDLLAAEKVLEGLIERGVLIVRIFVRRMAS